MKALGILLVAGGTITLLIMFPVLLIPLIILVGFVMTGAK